MKISNATLLFFTLQFTPSASKPFATASIKTQAFFQSFSIRGGETTDASTIDQVDEEVNLEDRVHAAMEKLGLSTPEEIAQAAEGGTVTEIKPAVPSPDNTETFEEMRIRLSTEMDVDEHIVQASLAATLQVGVEPEEQRLDEEAARKMIQYEVDAIQKVMEDSEEVQQLIAEGHDATLSRRALAFADMDIEMARAILVADEEDAKEEEEQMAKMQAEREEEEKRAQLRAEADQRKKEEAEMKTVNVDANFDPTTAPGGMKMGGAPAAPQGAPKPAKKEDVVFQATSENIQKLVLESPVPVLLDVYADWCGPCKALTPALEEMAVKGGGAFRLVKLNTDEERNISSALGVTSLPTIFGIKDGQIVHSFKGMPRDQDFMKNFMMGLLAGVEFNPAPTKEEKQEYAELSNKLIKIAGASGFSFSQRERMQVRTNNKLDELVEVRGDMSDAEESAKILRSLMSNVIKDPFEIKFRKVNLENKVISARVGAFDPAVSILKAVGFKHDEDSPTKVLVLGKGKKIVNIAPLVVARDAIDKWIDMNRRAIATALRKKQDKVAYIKLLEEAEDVESDDEEEEEEAPQTDPNVCALKLRIEGKKKLHDLTLEADDTLGAIIDSLPVKLPEGEEVTITCTARRLIVKSTDEVAMGKTLRESNLTPAASIVVKIGSGADRSESTSSLKERAAARKEKSKGEHTMQSIGIYSKDDNAKGELIDGGGGTWYEQDITSDDEAEENDEADSMGETVDSASDDEGSDE